MDGDVARSRQLLCRVDDEPALHEKVIARLAVRRTTKARPIAEQAADKWTEQSAPEE
jgi:hypothetical protein